MTKKQRGGLVVILAPIIALLAVDEHWAVFAICLATWYIGIALFVGMEDDK